METLKARIQSATKDAMRAKEKERLGVLRLIGAEIKQKEVDGGKALDDDAVIDVLAKMIKQRRDSVSQFEEAGRDDLASKEKAEIEVVQSFLPQPLTEEELDRIVAETIAETGATDLKSMGPVMNALRPRIKGRADMGVVSARVKAKLGAG